MATTNQGVYAPLPQSLSDSESDKEMPIIIRPKFINPNVENGLRDAVHSNGYVRPLQSHSQAKGRSMSFKRKCCFVFSIAICIITVITFLWVLPCSKSGTCPVKISNWENQHEGIELTGKINVVKGAFNTLNLVLFFKRNLNTPDGQSGLISVLGSDGSVAWYIPKQRTPKELNCYLVDVNNDGTYDCLLLTDTGLEAVDPVSGSVFWHAHDRIQNKIITNLTFPTVLQDLNDDGVNDLLTVKNKQNFALISGKSGALIGEIKAEGCSSTQIVETNITSLVYFCSNENHDFYHSITLNELIKRIFDKDKLLAAPETKADIPKVPHQTVYVLGGKALTINNIGSCPLNCRVEIALIHHDTSTTIASWSYQKSYAFVPVTFSFKSTESNMKSLKGHVNGFILKLWQWYSYKEKPVTKVVVKRRVPENDTIQVHPIMERVVLVTFNSSSYHVINASLVEITQLCFPNGDRALSCQPSMENQNNSLLISDLDMDGSQELISYSNSFIQRDGDHKGNNWQLMSNMKVIRLEAELPKLYETAK